jgi:hypothetical protein
LREDKKIKEISNFLLNLVNCLIPNIDKFNEVEERIINNYLPKLCFKGNIINIDLTHSIQQQQNTDKILKSEEISPNNITVSNPVPSDYLTRKTSRSDRTAKKESNFDKDSNTIGIKLICDNENEELRKYFSKTVS